MGKGKILYVVAGPITTVMLREQMEINGNSGVELIEQQIYLMEKLRNTPTANMPIKNVVVEIIELKQQPSKKVDRYLEKQKVKQGWKNPYRK